MAEPWRTPRRGRRGGAGPAHLRPYQWQPGESGNPSGLRGDGTPGSSARPTLESLMSLVLDEEIDPIEKPGVTKRHLLARKLIHDMLKSDQRATALAKLYFDRIWPAVRQHRVTAEMPAEYPDLSQIPDELLRPHLALMEQLRLQNAITVTGVAVLEESVAEDDDELDDYAW